MKVVRAVVDQVLGLFVADWVQTLGILAILALGYAAVRNLRGVPSGYLVALLLAAHLIYTTVAETRKRRAAADVKRLKEGEIVVPGGA